MRVRTLLLLWILTGIIFSGCLQQPQPSPEPRNETPEKFLSTSYGKLSTDDQINPKNFSLLDNALNNKEVFFAGEIHGIQGNELLDLELLKYLKKKVRIKYYLSEIGPSSAYFYNRYLTTGDEAYLNRLYNESYGTIGWTRETYDAWKSLYRFNQTLPPKERIKVIGIDIQHQTRIGVWHLKDLIPAKAPPSSIAGGVQKLKQLALARINTDDPVKIRQLASQLKKDLKDQKRVYKNYLGDKLFDFTMGVNNLIYVFNFRDIEQNYVKSARLRDIAIYDNFRQYYHHLPKGKFYGLWGRPHTYQKQQDNVNYVASLMNQKTSPVKDKVLSIAIFYKDCYRMAPQENGSYGKEVYTDENYMTEPLDKITDTKITLFKLIGKNTPFDDRLQMVDNPTGGGTTVDYFQYVIFIQKAGPSKPLAKR